MLDSIVYGNPSNVYLPYLERTSFLDKHFDALINFPFPKNSSKATREELNMLVDMVASVSKNEEILKRYQSYDHALEKTFAQLAMKLKMSNELIEMMDNLFDDVNTLLIKLKIYFQRPRPYQLAHAYKLKLFPYRSYSADSPSYPSGHALQSKVICYVLGNHMPEHFEFFENLANDICYSREYLGLHYRSDIDFAILCQETIVKDKEFKVKYKI